MEIKTETNYIPLILTSEDLPTGIQKRIIPTAEYRGLDYESLAIGVFSFAAGVIGKVLAYWIYDQIKKVKDKPGLKLKINEREITRISKEEITKVIEREINLSNQ
jgi:hypothetical protein